MLKFSIYFIFLSVLFYSAVKTEHRIVFPNERKGTSNESSEENRTPHSRHSGEQISHRNPHDSQMEFEEINRQLGNNKGRSSLLIHNPNADFVLPKEGSSSGERKRGNGGKNSSRENQSRRLDSHENRDPKYRNRGNGNGRVGHGSAENRSRENDQGENDQGGNGSRGNGRGGNGGRGNGRSGNGGRGNGQGKNGHIENGSAENRSRENDQGENNQGGNGRSRNGQGKNDHRGNDEGENDQGENGNRGNGRRGNGKKKGRRLCEQKYMEYIRRIFGDDDTVADSTDADFDGRSLAHPGEYPHMTALGFGSPGQPIEYKCGGSLISENFVITAAHCTNLTGLSPTKVRIGDLNLKVEERYLEPQIRDVKRIYMHPEYRSNIYYNDIALLELLEEVEFTEFVRPIKLWVEGNLPAQTIVFAMGYGATAFGKAPTNRLTEFNLTIVSNDECNKVMPQMPEAPLGILSSLICAKDNLMNRDTCQGDSGGPLQLNLRGRRRRNRLHYHLIGLTSYGLYCRSGYPSIYTRVIGYLDWIENIVWGSQ